ncbi:MAG TPA: hypothetical protein VHE55_05830 [Fimbriimonadaceae bacterium]|nr:hypothetical protein [Fimbriimonadaceae bacterium]
MRLALALLSLLFASACAQVTTPRLGSPERTAIMDSLRVPLEKELKQRLQFRIEALRQSGAWAFMKALPLRQDGRSVNYGKTPYAQAARRRSFTGEVCALFQKSGKKWKVVKYLLGEPAAAHGRWWKTYGAPKAIFELGK